jgi:lipopolysaccharide/colanic/teichoic acid biosynthesis glycosyltransferase
MIYANCLKRVLDFMLSLFALIVLSPILLLLTVCGAVAMGGNPFFTQDRPGKDEKFFKLIKFRTMNNKKDKDGNLLPDDDRLTAYGRFLRSTSLDELPELFNIVKGDMAVVGPRPLLTQYLPYYTKEERQRHDVRPGLTGLAQVNGRNTITWDEKFRFDVKYANSISFIGDCSIIISTVSKVFKRADILVGKEFTVGKLLEERKSWKLTPEGAIPDNEDKNTV